MFIAEFLVGPDKPRSKEPMNVQSSLVDFIVYRVLGRQRFLNRISKKFNYDFNSDYFKGVTWISNKK